jgi:hypothetical protein
MCCFSCNPHNKTLLDKELVKDYIRQAAEIKTVEHIAFTGGEAIIYFDVLRECMEYAKSLGLYSTLVSNGFWAKNYDEGYKKIAALKESGLRSISLSIDKFHQEFVPVESVRNALEITRKLGVLSEVTLMDLKDGMSVYNSIENFRDLLYGCNMVTYPCFPAGMARETIPEESYIYECESRYACCPFDHTITVLFDGTIMVCCSQFSRDIDMVKVGKFGETSLKQAVENLNNNSFMYVLLTHGFGWFVDLAKKLGKDVKDNYCISCHLCYDLFSDEKFVAECTPYVEREVSRLRLKKFMGK